MDYLNLVFLGKFAPQREEDAAINFILDIIFIEDRLSDWADMLGDGARSAGIEGDPGWILERCDEIHASNVAYYSDWPAYANFRAAVDESAYALAHPVFFMSRLVFLDYLSKAVEAYVALDSSRASLPAVISLRKENFE